MPSLSADQRERGVTFPLVIPPNPKLLGRNALILAGIAEGKTYAEIGKEFGITKTRVLQLWHQIRKELGARNAPHAVALGYQHGILGSSGLLPELQGLARARQK